MEIKLTEHFSLNELTETSHSDLQSQNRAAAVDYVEPLRKVCVELEKLREFIFRPVYIRSGFRCPDLNKHVGGVHSSQHVVGEAVDFTVKDFEDATGLEFIFDWCCRHLTYGEIILEKPEGKAPWIHIGLPRPGKPQERLVWNGKGYEAV